MLFMSSVCNNFTSVYCCLVVTCQERADLLALDCDVKLCCHFPICILAPVWLIVLIPDPCQLSYFYTVSHNINVIFCVSSHWVIILIDQKKTNRFFGNDLIFLSKSI